MFFNYWNNFTNLVTQERWGLSLEQVKQRHCLPDSQFIDVDGMEVHYRDVGTGPVLLCIHGIFSSLHNWLEWTDVLKDRYRVISLDMPNSGITGPHPEGVKNHLYSDFLNNFTDALNIEHCFIAGNSLGGWMSYEFAHRYPHKVNKLILLDSAGFFFIPPVALAAMGAPMLGWSLKHTPMPRMLFKSMVEDTYARPERLNDTIIKRYFDMMRRPGNRRAAARITAYIRNRAGFDTSYLNQLQQPTLVMWGKQDRWIPASHAAKFERLIPDCQRIMYDDCGHLPMEELGLQTATDAHAFLSE